MSLEFSPSRRFEGVFGIQIRLRFFGRPALRETPRFFGAAQDKIAANSEILLLDIFLCSAGYLGFPGYRVLRNRPMMAGACFAFRTSATTHQGYRRNSPPYHLIPLHNGTSRHPPAVLEQIANQEKKETRTHSCPQIEERGEGRNRTDVYSFCRAVPYHLATPPYATAKGHATRFNALCHGKIPSAVRAA